MAKKTIAPLDYYQDQFDKRWAKLYKLIETDSSAEDLESRHAKVTIQYLDSLAQLLSELTWAAKETEKKSKKSKKSKKK